MDRKTYNMAITTALQRTIYAFYRRKPESQIMFGFIRGIRRVDEIQKIEDIRRIYNSISIPTIIELFMNHYQLDHDTCNFDSSIVIASEMGKELKNVKAGIDDEIAKAYKSKSCDMIRLGYFAAFEKFDTQGKEDSFLSDFKIFNNG